MKKILQSWLFHQCQMLSGSIQAVLLICPSGEGPHDKVLFWPEKQHDHFELLRDAEAALRNKQALVFTRNNKSENTGEPLYSLTCPLRLNGRLFGAVAIEMANCSQPMQHEAVQQVQAGGRWLETMVQLQGSTLELISFALSRKNKPDYFNQPLGGLKKPDSKIVPVLAESAEFTHQVPDFNRWPKKCLACRASSSNPGPDGPGLKR